MTSWCQYLLWFCSESLSSLLFKEKADDLHDFLWFMKKTIYHQPKILQVFQVSSEHYKKKGPQTSASQAQAAATTITVHFSHAWKSPWKNMRLLQASAHPGLLRRMLGHVGVPHAYLGRTVRSIINEHLRCSKCMQSIFSAHMEGHWSECSLIFCFWLRQHFLGNKDDQKNNILMIKVSRFCLASRVMARSKPWMPRDLYKEHSLSD